MKQQHHNQEQIQTWYKICNMRTTLLQLQYLYCSVSEALEDQSINFSCMQKDRLIQYSQLSKQVHQLTSSNLALLLIVKLQSLLSIYTPIDNKIWQNLTQFIKCVKFIEQQMARDVCKLYIGANVMVDLHQCQNSLKIVQQRIVNFLKQNSKNIEQYNHGIQELKNVETMWENYFVEVTEKIKQKIQPFYANYLRRKLLHREKMLESNLKVLKQFIIKTL